MDLPPEFEKRVGSKVCKLQKSLYGLKQSLHTWIERFTRFMKKIGFCQGQTDHTLFLKYSPRGKVTVLIVYEDDIIISGDNTVEMNHFKKCLAAEFEIKDLEALRYFLGMEVARSKQKIVDSQQKHILDLLKETGMSGCKPLDNLIDPNVTWKGRKWGSNGYYKVPKIS